MTKKQKYYKRPTGPLGEYFALKIFPLSKLERRPGFDVRIGALDGSRKNSARIEVKTAVYHKNNGWLFHLERGRQHRWADVYLLICLNRNYEQSLVLSIPKARLLGQKSIWLGRETFEKYKQFLY